MIVATTESVRAAFHAEGNDDVKPFTPQLTLPIGTRISQAAFSSDESVLVLSAEVGGGLAVYDTSTLLQGNTQSAFELATGGAALRALAPNPSPANAHLIALVTTNGDLMMADMKSRQLVSTPNGQVLKGGVSCVSWSKQGKQLVAGLGDGTASQMTPDGDVKAELPRPGGLDGSHFISSMLWLENDLFMVVHTPSVSQGGNAPDSRYHIMQRDKQTKAIQFRKLPEVCGPWGMNRSPPFQFMQRLRDYEPTLKEAVMVASTVSSDVGLYTKSSAPLNSEAPAEQIVDVFTMTNMATDSRRAQMPMNDAMEDTSPIGMALDLSSKSNIPKPLPGEDMEESKAPLPGLMILNNEGLLAEWWIVYTDAVRQGVTYSQLAAYTGQPQPQHQQATAPSQPAPSSTSAFGGNAFGQSGFAGLGSSPKPPASNNSTLAFGGPSALGGSGTAFGGSSMLGNRQSPWGSTATAAPQQAGSTFGQAAFGSSSPMGAMGKPARTAFGAAGNLGQKASPWASSPTATSGTAFGQSSGLGTQNKTFGGAPTSSASPFAQQASSGANFSAFAGSGGFASVAAKSGGESVFKQPTVTPTTSFGSKMDTGSTFATPAKPAESFGGQKFTLGSSWKNPDAGKQDSSQTPKEKEQPSLFGSGFSNMLGEAAKEPAKETTPEADMVDDDAAEAKQPAPPVTKSIFGTPAKFPTAPPAAGGLFGTQAQGSTTPAAVQTSTPAPRIKEEPSDETDTPKDAKKSLPDPPLPPEPTSKTSYTPGSSSASSNETSKAGAPDAPLPPDFVKQRSKEPPKPAPAESAPLPPDSPESTPKAPEDAPLPPDFTKASAKPQEAAPLPPEFIKPKPKQSAVPVPPSPLASRKPSSEADRPHALPDDAGDGLDDEGSGVDVGHDLSPISEHSRNLTPESSFGAGKAGRVPLGDFVNIERPQAQQAPPVRPLFGEIGKTSVPLFPPPSKVQQSPRSPSPVRGVPGLLSQNEQGRSVSAPGITPFGQPPPQPRGAMQPPLQPLPKSQAPFPAQARDKKPPVRREVDEDAEEPERVQMEPPEVPEDDEVEDLGDSEDERVKEELEAEVEPTLKLSKFLAHQDYAGNVTKEGIPGQVEKVYRDIDSMLDTLGLNSRSLEGFLQGNNEGCPDGRERADLTDDKPDPPWRLCEIDDFLGLQHRLEDELRAGSLAGAGDKIAACRDLQHDAARLRAKQTDLKRQLAARADPRLQEALRAAPLAPEAAALRAALRAKFAALQADVARLEAAVTTLRARLASHGGGPDGANDAAAPTVEAVERTIRKMTAMAERKAGDVDALERALRRLGIAPGGAGGAGGSPASSRASTPFVTPPTSVRKPRPRPYTPASSVGGQDFRTPRSTRSALASSMASSTRSASTRGGWESAVARRVGEVSRQDVTRYAAKVERKAKVDAVIKKALMEREVVVRPVPHR